MMMIGIISVLALAAGGIAIFLNLPRFGRLSRGDRLERIRKSPIYIDGQFLNLEETEVMTTDENRFKAMWDHINLGQYPSKP